jgi:hypothetical protein
MREQICKLKNKSYTRLKEKDILAHKMSISFHPDDNNRLNYRMAFEIAKNFAEQFSHSKGHEVLFAVHTDTKHVHVHFLVSNCNINTGKSYRRNKKDLYEMSKYFGEQCLEYGLTNSVRENFYNHDLEQAKDRVCLAEKRMKERGVESFKDELREVVQQEIADPNNRTFEDVIRGLKTNWNVESRVAGNTVSYKHPEYKDKNGNSVSVRGSKLGDLYTVKGINYELNKKSKRKLKRTAEHDGIATGNQPFERSGFGNEGERQAGSGGQIASGGFGVNHEPNIHDLDRFYDRYTRRVEEVEPEPVRTPKRTKTLHR